MFDPDKCLYKVWCGKKKPVDDDNPCNVGYLRRGTPYECLKKGFGIGKAAGARWKLPYYNLLKENLIYDDIRSEREFVNFIKRKKSFRSTATWLDYNDLTNLQFNNIVVWLCVQGVPRRKLPACRRV